MIISVKEKINFHLMFLIQEYIAVYLYVTIFLIDGEEDITKILIYL